LPTRITQEEAAAHTSFVEEMGDGAVWKKFG
jgi:DNA polymerase-3 subunit epsilon